jgi:trimethylamine--corrinoid protein Co-methyltransferase
MFRNQMPRYEVLSPDAIAVLDKGWRRIVSEIGVQFAKPEAVELFRKAGQRVDGEVVFLDPEFVLEQVALAPREFDVQARNPANSVHIGEVAAKALADYQPPPLPDDAIRAELEDFVARRRAELGD